VKALHEGKKDPTINIEMHFDADYLNTSINIDHLFRPGSEIFKSFRALQFLFGKEIVAPLLFKEFVKMKGSSATNGVCQFFSFAQWNLM
jgi:hypothetical protein